MKKRSYQTECFDITTETSCEGLLRTYTISLKGVGIMLCSGACLYYVRDQTALHTYDHSQFVCLLDEYTYFSMLQHMKTVVDMFEICFRTTFYPYQTNEAKRLKRY
jgi:hypothetical protein